MTEAELLELDKQLPLLRERASLLVRACSTRPQWVNRIVLEQEMQAIGLTAVLPADARSRWEVFAAERDRVRSELDRVKLLAERIKFEQSMLPLNSELIGHLDEIEALLLSAENISTSRLDRKVMQAEQREHREAMERLLFRIAPDWTENELRSLRVTIADRESVREVRAAMTESDRTRSGVQAELRSIREQLSEISELESESGYTNKDGQAWIRESDEPGWIGDKGRKHAHFTTLEWFALLPVKPDALRHAARVFEEAWRNLELEQLRAAHEAATELPGMSESSASRGSWGLWSAAALAAMAAAGLGAAGWSTAAIAASAAAAALAALALLRQLRRRRGAARAAAPSGAGAAGSRRGRPARPAPGAAGAALAAERAPADAASAAKARLAAAERRVAAALASLVREPSAALAALLANQIAAGNPSGSDPPGIAGNNSRDEGFAAVRAYAEEAAASSADAKLSAASEASRSSMPSTAVLLERLRALIDTRLDELRSSEHDAHRRNELKRRRARLQAQEQALLEAADAAAGNASTITADWRDWLMDRALPPTLSPEAAMETFDLAEQAMLRLQAYDRIAAKAAVLDSQLAAYDAAADRLSDAFPSETKSAAGDSVIALRLLHNEAIRQTNINKQVNDLHTKLAEYNLQLAELETALERLLIGQQQWFSAAEAADELQLLEVLAKSERIHQIESQRFRLSAELNAGMSEEQLRTIEAWFAESDAEQLASMRARAEEERAEHEKRKSDLLSMRGRQQQQMDLLYRDTDRQRLTAERERTSAALEQLVERYAVLAMSMTMIQRTKRVMEEERQPAVIREASRFMALLSEGKYRRIAVPEGEQTIWLEQADGRLIDSQFLSRGTAEQLYLAMRFALADEASGAVELPMILDDLFVNFDRNRLEAAIQVIAELSGRRQIIMLTCHEHVRDLMIGSLPNVQLVELT